MSRRERSTIKRQEPPPSYVARLRQEAEAMHEDYREVLAVSGIKNVDPNRAGSSVFFVNAPEWGWTASDPSLEAARMRLLQRFRAWQSRFRLLFPHPTPEVTERLDEALERLERWLVRPRDTSVPATIDVAEQKVADSFADLHALTELLPADDFRVRLVVDTNTLIDDPDLSIYRPLVGDRYMIHLLPVVLRELDDHKRAGRTPELREAARRADRRLKGFRDNGDVLRGARVVGDMWAVFEHVEPKTAGLPSWLDMSVADDRFIGAVLELQSSHPASALYVATSDLNLQTKLAAVGLPFLEPPLSAE